LRAPLEVNLVYTGLYKNHSILFLRNNGLLAIQFLKKETFLMFYPQKNLFSNLRSNKNYQKRIFMQPILIFCFQLGNLKKKILVFSFSMKIIFQLQFIIAKSELCQISAATFKLCEWIRKINQNICFFLTLDASF